MPLSIAGLKAHPGSYIGPPLVSLALECVQTGILINQSLTFWERAERELGVVRGIVSFVTITAFVQTAFGFFASWRMFVENFGNWYESVLFSWADKVQSTITVMMAAPVQAFLIWRCWTLINRNFYVLGALTLLLLAQIVASVIVTVETFQFHFGIVPQSEVDAGPLPKVKVNPTFVLSLTCSAVLDVLVTGILLTFLARSKQHVTSSRFRRILRRLTVLIWEAALPPCVCAILTVVTYLTLVNENYWDLTFQAILGKLYVISLFVTLQVFPPPPCPNGRAELQDGPAPGFSTNRISNLAWNLSTPIRVDINTDVESRGETTQSTRGDGMSAVDTPSSEPSRTVVTPASEKPK
ncbi:hypothetical protein L226DRAFT_574028 [Lentinus tigrinus ALCF2SS1-7]|uniref:DUF6534 domain-containing protein n=1 Tax=Lentinus tigrinus ALCF2SS1-6 TaxID=1328759 RepID=A0A5C2RW21_9APHY|nr:hypothetical protein L227DRAFT_615379 [Lentinus tigrinus ALCF2SS1-6]RPD71262.1 hypothetical protein L226DRAFT_574028 [Lentinus tigrinus ALCF2SS1-7]